MFWISRSKSTIHVMFGKVLTGKPPGWRFPFATQWNLWIWTEMRPRHAGWRRHLEQKQDELHTTYYWGPCELSRKRPRPTRPDVYWRVQAERHYRRMATRQEG